MLLLLAEFQKRAEFQKGGHYLKIIRILQMRKSQKGTDLNYLPKSFLQITQKSLIRPQSAMSTLIQKRKTDLKTW